MSKTLKDVAKLAGVDICSVSRTLSHHPLAMNLRTETRERIFEAAQKLGYRRNLFAACIRRGENPTIAIIMDEYLDKLPSAQRLMSGLLKVASEANYAIKLYSPDNLDQVLNNVLSYQIKMIVCSCLDRSFREQLALLCRQHALNLVFLYEHPHSGFPSFNSDNYGLMCECVEHVIQKGHTRIGFVCSNLFYNDWRYLQERYRAFIDTMKRHGLEPNMKWMLFPENMSDGVDELLDLPAAERPSVFVCVGDGLALDVQRRAFRRGMRLPDEVSVTGFGGDPYYDLNMVSLTTVIEDHERIGRSAVEYLLNGHTDLPLDEFGVYRCRGRFVERESVSDLRRQIG